MQIGLFFGSFNPIHVGHLIIANHVLTHSKLDRIWFVVSPHNPLKESSSLLPEQQRLHMVRLAIEKETKFSASNIEFQLPKPSYTIDTMLHLTEKFPQHTFTIIVGGDSFQNLPKWKNYQQLVAQYPFIVYNRPGFAVDTSLGKSISITQAPLLDISSTYIRGLIQQKKSIRYLVVDEVMEVMEANGYYR